MKNLLLVDSDVRDYQTFVDSVNEDTIPFVYTLSTTREELLDFIGNTTIERMALVSHQKQRFLGGPFYSDTNTSFFIDAVRQYQIKHLDFLACDTLNNPLWKAFYDSLHTETGVLVGASDNPTGNLKYGGDWILESTSEDIELVYFANTIEYYKYLLGSSEFTMVVKLDGTIWGTGYNQIGQLGDGTTINKSSFINITTLQSSEFKSKTVKYLTNGDYHTMVLMTDGTLWACGDNQNGGPGVTVIGNKFTLVPFTGGTIESISAGSQYTILYTTNNTIWGCGRYDNGQLGISSDAPTTFTKPSFIQLSGITGTIKSITCSDYSTFVLTTSNKLWVTGYNPYGNLGLGDTTDRYAFTVVNIDTLSGRIPEFISGFSYYGTIISMTDGTLWGAGADYYVGTGTTTGILIKTFTQASNGNNYYNGSRKVKKICGGYNHFLVLMSDGTLWAITSGNSNIPIGMSTSTRYNIYTQITTTIPNTIFSVYAGKQYSALLDVNNIIYLVGSNNLGQLGYATPSSTTSFLSPLTNVASLPNDNILFSPTITTITQNANGLITILGTNFNTPTVTMTGGYTSGTVTKVSSTQLTFTPNAFIGSSTFTVTDGGNSISLTASFPNITSFTPTMGIIGTLVTITGSNLGNVTMVVFGSVNATSPSISATTITVNAPTNVRNVLITLTDSNGNSVATSTTFSYNTNPTLFTTSTSDLVNKLLSPLSLTNGIADTGILQLGSALTTTNLSGTTYGVTVSSNDNSSSLATTAFVKAQNYATLAQMAVAQTWSAIQTFNGILSSKYDALTTTSILSVGSNLTTGTLNLGTSTSSTTLAGTSVNINNPTIMNPFTIGYTTTTQAQPVPGTFNQIGSIGNRASSTFTSGSTGQIQAVMNGIPNGRYLLFAYVYLPSGSALQRIEQRFGYSFNALTNGQTSGYALLGEGMGEMFGHKVDVNSNYSHNVCQFVDINDRNGNLGIWILTGSTTGGVVVSLNLMRLS